MAIRTSKMRAPRPDTPGTRPRIPLRDSVLQRFVTLQLFNTVILVHRSPAHFQPLVSNDVLCFGQTSINSLQIVTEAQGILPDKRAYETALNQFSGYFVAHPCLSLTAGHLHFRKWVRMR